MVSQSSMRYQSGNSGGLGRVSGASVRLVGYLSMKTQHSYSESGEEERLSSREFWSSMDLEMELRIQPGRIQFEVSSSI